MKYSLVSNYSEKNISENNLLWGTIPWNGIRMVFAVLPPPQNILKDTLKVFLRYHCVIWDNNWNNSKSFHTYTKIIGHLHSNVVKTILINFRRFTYYWILQLSHFPLKDFRELTIVVKSRTSTGVNKIYHLLLVNLKYTNYSLT